MRTRLAVSAQIALSSYIPPLERPCTTRGKETHIGRPDMARLKLAASS